MEGLLLFILAVFLLGILALIGAIFGGFGIIWQLVKKFFRWLKK